MVTSGVNVLLEDSLGLGGMLGEGGQGSVHGINNISWGNAPRAVSSGELVYKKYKQKALQEVDRNTIEAMPRFLEGLEHQERLKLLKWIAWPLKTVYAGGSLSGFGDATYSIGILF